MKTKGYTAEDHVEAYLQYGSTRKAAEALGVHHSAIQRSVKEAGIRKAPMLGDLGGHKALKLAQPKKGEVKRYIITCAQNNTKINVVFWERLLALADFYSAQVYVCPFTYNPRSGETKYEEPSWAPEIEPYLVSERVELHPSLVLCAEVTRMLPTAARPLSGFETYTGRASGIFPHPKVAMDSIPSMLDEPAKFNYTTGAVTRHNYTRTKAGFKGEFHHSFGAVIAEVTSEGWWVRQINADSQNRIYDLDVCVDDEGVTYGNTVDTLVYGDFHARVIDPKVLEATWGDGGLTDFLMPDNQVLHDFFDMESRPWQDMLSFGRMYEKHVRQKESVWDEIVEAHALYTGKVHREWAQTVFVRSNHDVKLEKWLDTTDYKSDLPNAEFHLEAQLERVRAIKRGDCGWMALEWAMRKLGMPENVRFLKEDESFVICKTRSGGIECGAHGHLGPNGSKGTPLGLARMARKIFMGDKHSPGIVDGVYTVGTCTPRRLSYVRGPSSWANTHGVAYRNGKRALLNFWNGAFFAPRDSLYE